MCRLAKGMTYKHAAAGLDQGGGKAVILGDPATMRTDELILAYGRFVDGLSGRYVTAEDVGTTQADMDLIRTVTPHVARHQRAHRRLGRPVAGHRPGRARAPCRRWPSASGAAATSRVGTCASAGSGKVGSALADHLHDEGGRLTVADVSPAAVAAVAGRTGATVVAPDRAHTVACDIFSPCALGAILSAATIPELKAAAVVGSANNQLATEQDAQRIHDAGVLYAPDYVVNAGGVINIAYEKGGYDRSRADERIRGIHDTVRSVLDLADGEGIDHRGRSRPPRRAHDRGGAASGPRAAERASVRA